jgi:hypothetical protein
MILPGNAQMPAAAEYEGSLQMIREQIDAAAALDCDGVLTRFCARPIHAAAFHVYGLHHVAVYLGDYESEDELASWMSHLEDVAGVADVRIGPSHVAPRHHGTPGYWMSCLLDGRYVEMFACKHVAPWAGLEHRVKVARMSHLALRVEDAEHVSPALQYLAHYPAIELLTFSLADDAGHTYGHLVNRDTDEVLELVHEQPQER